MTGRNAHVGGAPLPDWKPQRQAVPVTARVHRMEMITVKAVDNAANKHFAKIAARALKVSLPKLRFKDGRGGFPGQEIHQV
jgi:hypothetical protein